MKTVGIFDAKTRLSEICETVAATREPVLVTRRGTPVARIEPVTDAKSDVWERRERFVQEYGISDELPKFERGA
jgi:prevent-host-death family protein